MLTIYCIFGEANTEAPPPPISYFVKVNLTRLKIKQLNMLQLLHYKRYLMLQIW